MTTRITPAPAYQRPSGKLYLGSDQLNLVHDTATLVELDTIASGFTDGIEDTANHKITPGVAGFYLITAQVRFMNLVAEKTYKAGIVVNAASYYCHNITWAGGGVYLTMPLAALVKLTATDYVRLFAESESGDDTVDIGGSQWATFLSVQRVR